MRKCFSIICIMIICWLAIATSCSQSVNLKQSVTTAGEKEFSQESVFIFPSLLQRVDEEAFSGTAVKTIIFPNGLLQIGDRAFENAWDLTYIFIPKTTEYIADSAFTITPNLTIYGVDGSYSKEWAHSHEIPFVVNDIWNVFIPERGPQNTPSNPISRCIATIVLVLVFLLFRSYDYRLRSRRPQDRPELYPIEYRFP